MALENTQAVIDIVLAEDDLDDVNIFKMTLANIAIHTHLRHAGNGEKLLVLLEQLIPNVLFLDIHMPCKDGFACIDEIRQQSKYDTMPIVVYS